MTCKNCKTKPIWEFTNQTRLCKNCFTDYFEMKVFKTIRKYQMLPENRIIKLEKNSTINTNILKYILEKKFKVRFSVKPNFSSKNLSQSAEKIFSNILKGKFKGPTPTNPPKPLYFLSNKEIKLYASLKEIKGKLPKQDKKIQELFQKFLTKNPDLEHNIINAFKQLSI